MLEIQNRTIQQDHEFEYGLKTAEREAITSQAKSMACISCMLLFYEDNLATKINETENLKYLPFPFRPVQYRKITPVSTKFSAASIRTCPRLTKLLSSKSKQMWVGRSISTSKENLVWSSLSEMILSKKASEICCLQPDGQEGITQRRALSLFT